MTAESDDVLETAVLGGGCFWCVEAAFRRVRGVKAVDSGYAGGAVDHPTYRQICSGRTGHAEVVRVRFDPDVVSYRDILRVFFTVHDPTTRDRQGADVGSQYRSIILVSGEEQREIAEAVIRELEESGEWPDPVVTEIAPLDRFWHAEKEHHEFYERNRAHPYCRVVIDPKLSKLYKAHGKIVESSAR